MSCHQSNTSEPNTPNEPHKLNKRTWRLPLHPQRGRVLLQIIILVSLMEFIRSGLYGAYLPQITGKLMSIPKQDAVVFSSSALSVHFIADVLSRGPLGALLSRVGVRPVLMVGVFLSIVAVSLMSVSHLGWMLLLAAALHGLGSSVLWPTLMSMAAEASFTSHQGRVVTAVTLSTIPAIAGGPLFMLEMAQNWSIAQVFLFCYVFLALGCVLILFLPRRLRLRAASTTPATPATSSTDSVPSNAMDERAKTAEEKRKTDETSAQLNWFLLLPMLPAAMLQTMTLSLLGPLIFAIYPEMGLTKNQTLLVLALGGIGAACAFPFTGRFADRGFARQNLIFGFALISMALGVVATVPPLWGLMLSASLVGVGYALIMPGWSALVVQVLPEKQRPAAWGVLMAAESVGVTLGAPLGAYAYRDHGVMGPFLLSAGLAFIATVGYAAFGRFLQNAIQKRLDQEHSQKEENIEK